MNIMAPAAKLNADGRAGYTIKTISAPINPAIISTNPDKCPYQTLFKRDSPSRLSGKETAIPSGKFWIPIPIVGATAPAMVAPGKAAAATPKATPIASSSGYIM